MLRGRGGALVKLWALSFGPIRDPEAVPESGRSIFYALITQSRN